MNADQFLALLQPLSDTPLRMVWAKPSRLTAIGGLDRGPAVLSERIRGLGAELVDDAHGGLLYRLDGHGLVVSCTSFGGLLLQQVPDVERFIASYLRG